MPALLEIACAISTPRSRALARALGAPPPASPPAQPPAGQPRDVTQSFAVPADGTITHTVTTSGTLRFRFENLSREFDSSRCATLLIQVSVDGKTGEEIGVIPGDTIVFRDAGRVSPGRHTFTITSRVYRGACEPIPHPGGRFVVITSTG